jgi:hypothetical protein
MPSCGLACVEREKLTAIYLDTVARSNEIASLLATFQSAKRDKWLEEMPRLRKRCELALSDLDEHIAEHRC